MSDTMIEPEFDAPPEEVTGWEDHFTAETETAGDGEESSAERPRWQIESDAAAMWAGRRASAAAAEIDRINEVYAAELDRLNEWRDARINGPRTQWEWFSALVIGWHVSEHERLISEGVKPRAKVSYGGLTASIISHGQAVVVTDSDRAAVALLRSGDDGLRGAVAVTYSVRISEVRKRYTIIERAVTEAGEILTRDPKSRKTWPPKGATPIESILLLDGAPVTLEDSGLGIQAAYRTISAAAGGQKVRA